MRSITSEDNQSKGNIVKKFFCNQWIKGLGSLPRGWRSSCPFLLCARVCCHGVLRASFQSFVQRTRVLQGFHRVQHVLKRTSRHSECFFHWSFYLPLIQEESTFPSWSIRHWHQPSWLEPSFRRCCLFQHPCSCSTLQELELLVLEAFAQQLAQQGLHLR